MPCCGRSCDPYTRHNYLLQCDHQRNIHVASPMVALLDLEVKAADVFSAYITAHNREKTRTVLGLEFGDDASKSAIIVRALYSLNNTCASFRAHLAYMQELGYKSCDADPDL